MGEIDMLNVDELLIIFNLLSLFDKFMILRVCKKWYNVIKDTHAWKVINFKEEGPVVEEEEDVEKKYQRFASKDDQHVFAFRKIRKRLRFPTSNHENVLRVVKLYAGVALQELHIIGMCGSVMDLLRINCPNLKQIYCSTSDDEMTAVFNNEKRVQYLQQILVECHVSCQQCVTPKKIVQHEQMLILLAGCSNLQCVTLQGCNLSPSGLQQLTANSHLREIQLVHCRCDRLGTKDLISEFDSTHVDDIFTHSVGSISSLLRFRLSGQPSKIDRLLKSFGNLKHLQDLSLEDVRYSEQSFQMMVARLPHLQSLVLNRVTSSIVSIIGKHLKELKFLDLTEGLKRVSCESLRSLCHHPCLKTLWYTGNPSLSVHTIHVLYEIMATLVNTNYVKLTGRNIHHLYNHQVFPVADSTQFEIVDLGNEKIKRVLGEVSYGDKKVQEKWTITGYDCQSI